MFSYDDCVHNWLPCSIWIQPLPKRGSHQCGRFRHWSSAEQRTEPQVCATRLHSDDNRLQVGEMLLHEGVEAYKEEGTKFMQRLVAKPSLGSRTPDLGG